MDEIQELLYKRREELIDIESKAEAFLKDAPDGTLRTSKRRKNFQYYHIDTVGDSCGKYISKSKVELIKALAQKDYSKKICKAASKELKITEKYLEKYSPGALNEAYDKLHFSRKKLVESYTCSDEDFVTKWKLEKQTLIDKRKMTDYASDADERIIITEQGERVRSKSEKIIADKLFMMDVPYAYECPLYLKGFGYIKPDFTVLNIRTRKEYFFEHLGLMDNEEYCTKAIKKIETYEANNYHLGTSLILTFETQNHSINSVVLDKKIREFFV